MVWTNSQYQLSASRPTSAFAIPACAAMAASDGEAADAVAAAEEPTLTDGARGDGTGEPTAAAEAPPPASGEAAVRTEAPALPPTGGEGGSSTDHLASQVGGVKDKGSGILDEIQKLKAEQKAARDKKMQISKELRNAEKRRQRLKRRAKQLSDADLVAVMTLRAGERTLSRNRVGEPTAADGADPDDSETGSVASTSTRGAKSASQSPMKPKKKAR